MAYQFLVNQAPADGGIAMWNLVSRLIASGWTKIKDSDGSTYSNTGAQVTGGNSGANGLLNTRAWVVLQSPAGAGGRQICIQSTFSDGYYWRIKYSKTAGFTGGAPDATTVPSATDEAILFGGGTDASPGTVQYIPTNNTYYQQIIVDNAAPYGFAMIIYTKITGITYTVFIMDPLLANTYPVGDQDPMVAYCYYTTAEILGVSYFCSEATGPACWLKYGLGGAGFVGTPPMYYTNASGFQVVPGAIGQNAITGDDESFPVLYGRRGALAAPIGYKGVSSMMVWKGSNRAVGDTYNTKARATFGDISIVWDSTTTPAL
jgi:hypothetical protein